MSDISYHDPRLAAVYDALNPLGDDSAFYLEMAGAEPRTILDMGCGTGLLTTALAARGHLVTGADPAAAMLDIARQRPHGDRVKWIESDAARLDLEARFDLIVMTGHVFQVFLSDEAISAALGNLRRHLAPDGRLIFETRNPARRQWLQWTPEATRRRLDIAGVGSVDVHYEVTAMDGQMVSYASHFRFGNGDAVIAPSTLRFVEPAQLATALAGAGFGEVAWYGDWDRSPLLAMSAEIIVVASQPSFALGGRGDLRY
ncbi:class I SAM-dependent methyltransferase [Aminobacter sp. HY435]|uniref:class I SAM-dependent methyltransferase n=1 Tax=Aminobacter sp. HY435 TaxID=2970917 RepID=UPI0022B972A0|nr:class I SAM-dependent methyltransferase [Aminobacter sp. HY435]